MRAAALCAAAGLMMTAACTPDVSSTQAPYPPIPTTGRYSSLQYTEPQLTTVANQEYGTAVNVAQQMERLLLDVYLPPDEGRGALPTIVLVHGGGFISGSRNDMASTAKSYARRGFVVANIDYRLDPDATTSVDRYLQAATAAIDDGMEAARWLKANASIFRIDTSRIAFVGSSAGGAVALGVGAANDPTPGGPLGAFSPSVAAVVSTGATLSPGIESGLVSFEGFDAAALMFHYEVDTVTQFSADYSRRTCDLLVLAGSACRWVQQAGRGHTVSLSPAGPYWTSEIGPFLWSRLQLSSAP